MPGCLGNPFQNFTLWIGRIPADNVADVGGRGEGEDARGGEVEVKHG